MKTHKTSDLATFLANNIDFDLVFYQSDDLFEYFDNLLKEFIKQTKKKD